MTDWRLLPKPQESCGNEHLARVFTAEPPVPMPSDARGIIGLGEPIKRLAL
jgi:hypothetical protein